MEIPFEQASVNDVPKLGTRNWYKKMPFSSQKREIAVPKERKKLLLAPRTKPMEPAPPPSDAASSNSVFGGAKPVDTGVREREIEEKLAQEQGTIPKYTRSKREVRKCTSSVIGNDFRLSSYSCKDDDRLVPCYKPPILRESNPELEQVHKLFLGGLNYKTTEETLKSHFEKWGEIVQCIIPRDAETKKSRGFAFVTYKKAHMVDDAIAAAPHEIDGREVVPKQAQRSKPKECNPEPEQVHRLFLGGLNYKTTEETLKCYFEKWGKIIDCVIPKDPETRKSRGFGFVTYEKAHMVDDAIAAGPYQIDWCEVVPKQALPKEQHDSELHKQCNTLNQTRTGTEAMGNSSNGSYRKAKQKGLAKGKISSRSRQPSDPEWEKSMCSRLLKIISDYKQQFISLDNEKKDISEKAKSLSEKEKDIWEKIADEMNIVFPLDCSGSTCIKKFTRLKTIYDIMKRDNTEIQDINLFNELQNVFGSSNSSVSNITVITDDPVLNTSCDNSTNGVSDDPVLLTSCDNSTNGVSDTSCENSTNTVSKTESKSLEMVGMLSSENFASLSNPKNILKKPRLLKKWKRPMKSLLLKTYSHYKQQFITLENEKKCVSEEGNSVTKKEIILWEKIAEEMKKVFSLDFSASACIKKFAEMKTVYEMMKLNDSGICDININYFNDLENVFQK